MREALVLGAGGVVGAHLVRRLRADGLRVRGVDLRLPPFAPTAADEFVLGDLRDPRFAAEAVDRPFDEVYQLAADLGGAGFLHTGANDADLLRNSALVNLNVVDACRRAGVGRVFFASSSCVYPDGDAGPGAREEDAYPANPDSEYGWEKLLAERLYLAHRRNHGLTCRIARYFNVYGPEDTWEGGREKVVAALCRKVAEAGEGGTVEVWGDGRQRRSFVHVDDCVEGTVRLLRSDAADPVNLGALASTSVAEVAEAVLAASGKRLTLRHVPGPLGVRGRDADLTRLREAVGWVPGVPLAAGLAQTYAWVAGQVAARGAAGGAG